MLLLIMMFEGMILFWLSMTLEYLSWFIMFLSIISDNKTWPIRRAGMDVMSWLPIMLVYLSSLVMGTSMFCFLMFMLVNLSRPIMLEIISLPILLSVLSRPIIWVDTSWPNLFGVRSRPIMLEDIPWLIMWEDIPWFIMSEDLYMVDIWSIFGSMLNEVMSCPIILLDIFRKSFPSSLSELESM